MWQHHHRPRVTDEGTLLWVKNRRDGRCLISDDCDFELFTHLIDDGIGDVESNIITLCGIHKYQADTELLDKTFMRKTPYEIHGYEIQD